MGKRKRNRDRRRTQYRWYDNPDGDPMVEAQRQVREAEEQLLLARQRAAVAANARPAASPEEQAEEFFNRPGDFYIAQFEIDVPEAEYDETPGPIRAQCVLKADEAQRDYLVEIMRQIRGGFGEGARISLSRARQQQQRVVDGAEQGIGAAHRAAREAVRRRNEQMLADGCGFDKPMPADAAAGWLHGGPWTAEQELLDDATARDLTREELQAQLPGQTRAEVAAELGLDPAEIGGDIKHADTIEIEQLAAELGVSPLDLQPIDMRGGGRAYTVKPRQAPQQGRHARP